MPARTLTSPMEPIPAAAWRVAAVVTIGSFVAGLDGSLISVGLETLGRQLGTSLTSTQWVSSGYLLAMAATLPACGWLSRRLGAGRLWLWALGVFTLASVLCAIAPDVGLLIVFRVPQGIAGGLLASSGMTILAEVAGPGSLGRVMSVTAVPTVLAPALGPIIGALLLANLSWPWLFLVNLPIGVAGLAFGAWAVPRGDRGAATRIDLWSLFLVAGGLPLLIYGITETGHRRTPPVLACLFGGVVMLVLFANRSLRRESPLLDLRLFRDRGYTAATSAMFFGSAALFGGVLILPLYLQLQRGLSIVDAGFLLLPFELAAAVTFPFAGRLTDHYGGGRIAVAGLALTTLATVPLAFVPAETSLLAIEALQVGRGIGLALFGASTMAVVLTSVARHQLPDATAQVNILANVGSALGGALLVVILTNGLVAGARETASAAAFHTTFWWLTAVTLAGLLGAVRLLAVQHRAIKEEAS